MQSAPATQQRPGAWPSGGRSPMTKWIVGLAVGVLATLALAGSVQAAPFTPRLNLAYKVANEYWGGPPTECTTIELAVVPDGSLAQSSFGGEATTPSGPESNCFLYVVRNLARPKLFAAACLTVAHEVGHLHGLQHSSDPFSVMYVRALTRNTTPQCRSETQLQQIMLEHGPLRDRRRAARRFWAPLRDQ